jgi:hypothetical protein
MEKIIEAITNFFTENSSIVLNEENFRALFGVGLQTVLFSWILLLKVDGDVEIEPVHLLWTLYFLKQYPISRNVWYFKVDRKTFKKYVWRVIALLHIHLNTVSITISKLIILVTF